MKHLWTWKGKYLGYRDDDNLWTHDGKHVGHFLDDEVYGADGKYLGEIRSNNRLITKPSKKNNRKSSFRPYAKRGGVVKPVGYVGNVMIAGYKDFPQPKDF